MDSPFTGAPSIISYLENKKNTWGIKRRGKTTCFRNSLGYGFVIVVGVGPRTGGFPLDDRDFHVTDLDSDQQKVDFPHDHVFQMVSEIRT